MGGLVPLGIVLSHCFLAIPPPAPPAPPACAIAALFLHGRTRQLRNGTERGLCRVQTKPKILVGVGREHVRGLMPLRVPAGADLRTPLVFAQADRGGSVPHLYGIERPEPMRGCCEE